MIFNLPAFLCSIIIKSNQSIFCSDRLFPTLDSASLFFILRVFLTLTCLNKFRKHSYFPAFLEVSWEKVIRVASKPTLTKINSAQKFNILNI